MRVLPRRYGASLVLFLLAASCLLGQGTDKVDSQLIPTGQLLQPAGESVAFAGRPVDLAPSPDGKYIYIKDNRGLVVLNAATWQVVQELPLPQKQGSSMHGIAVRHDGQRVYVTTAQQWLWEAEVIAPGKLNWKRSIVLPGPKVKDESHSTGIALTADGKQAYVCLSRNNSLAIVDLEAGRLTAQIPVSVAPFDVVLTKDEKTAYVSNWGGRHPKAGEKTAPSSGTPTLVDERGIACSGTVCQIDLTTRKVVAEVETGLHSADLVLSSDGKTAYVANANSDTVSMLNTSPLGVRQNVLVRPDARLPYGSATNALALSADGKMLYAANGGNNAVAVLRLDGPADKPASVAGFIPTGWYPGALLLQGDLLYIANVKGEGSRMRDPQKAAFHVKNYRGTVSRVHLPNEKELAAYTTQVHAATRVPQLLRLQEKARKGVVPVPVPQQAGEPSVFEHVVYVIKENRTYDQVLGDLKQGNGDPKLCIFGREWSPNHHALAEQFVLLDNFYCNGVLSADGHSWATEGNVTDHLEKAFGGFTRSYTFGDDPLTYSSSGFLWDNVLLHGLSFRNYGEMDDVTIDPKDTPFAKIYDDFLQKKGQIRFKHSIGIDTLRRYSNSDYPGWNLNITDMQRFDFFVKEFREHEKKGEWPELVIVHLPQDHTSGTTPDMPTPRAHMADNDLALGKLVEAISHSRFWKSTCIFVIEDDPQDGFDHVDGHRSMCLVISPYTNRGQVVRQFYNQTSVVHTMERILGLPAMNQLDGLAPLMNACFTDKPNMTPYTALSSRVALNELNPKKSQLKGAALHWAEESLKQDFRQADRVDDDMLNRILWHAMKGTETPYPAEFAGAHGKGLKGLKLRLER